jgi:hypothetical protein
MLCIVSAEVDAGAAPDGRASSVCQQRDVARAAAELMS